MNLEIVASPSKILEIQPSRNFFIKTIKGVLKFLEKYFGSEMLVKIPSGLYGIDNKLLKAVDVAHKLQSLGIIKNITKRPKYFDEPVEKWTQKALANRKDLKF
ncbi:MAG: hypothetical protein KKD92_09155 [Proteobacteria bacterium]|nr:hypothetical protein [Pseudomonadota bacterium]